MIRPVLLTVAAAVIGLSGLAAVPAGAQAADTFADASRPNDNADCLTPATACKTINGALAKASAGFAVHVEPGTYAENVTLNSGVSLVADSGNPVIAPAAGPAVTVSGGAPPHITGLTFASSADGPEVLLGDGAGNSIVADNSFINRTPNDTNQPVGIRTTSTGSAKIANNSFTLLQDGVQVMSPAAGAPGRPVISGNIIIGAPDFGSGILVRSTDAPGVTAPTTASLVANQIQQGAEGSTGVQVLDGGSIVGDPSIPGAGLTMVNNRISGGGDGLRDFAARAPVTLFGDVIAQTGSVSPGQVVRSAINANANASLGGDLTVTNADLLESPGPAIQLSDDHLTLDSSIVTGPVTQAPGGASSCTITFSAGPTTNGNSCQTFQTDSVPSFFNPDDPAGGDFHLNPALDRAFIDHGNPAAPPAAASDLDGDPRALDGTGICPLNPVRDIGADEFNPGVPTCQPPDTTPPATTPPAQPGAMASSGQTGRRIAALRKCKSKHGAAHRSCVRRARRLPL